MSRPIVSMMHLTATTFLCLILQGCGSSGSGAGGQAAVPFSAPVDAVSLGAALTTGSAEFWECALSGEDAVFEYRFFSDGTGVETDQNNPGPQSNLTWQATSASSMETTMIATGAQLTLTDIQFTGRDSIRPTLNGSISLVCSRMGGVIEPAVPTEDVAAGNNTLSYGGVVYSLTHGYEEAYSFRLSRNDTHRGYMFQVADANFVLLQILTGGANPLNIWRPNFASVWLRADLNTPGADDFQTATFQYISDDVDERGPEVVGKYYFNQGTFGIDADGVNGFEVDANEFIDVVGGTITVTRRAESQAAMSFDLVLENGATLTGSFSGIFPVIDYNL